MSIDSQSTCNKGCGQMYFHVASVCTILHSRSSVAVEHIDFKDSVGTLGEVLRCGSMDNDNRTTQPNGAVVPKEADTRHGRASTSLGFPLPEDSEDHSGHLSADMANHIHVMQTFGYFLYVTGLKHRITMHCYRGRQPNGTA